MTNRIDIDQLHIGIDVGGTFTDVVAMNASGQRARAKAPTSQSQADGLIDALTVLAESQGVDLNTLLSNTTHLSAGTTIVTNTIAELNGRPTGLLVTKGFRDTLRIARSPRVPTVDPFAQVSMPEIVPNRRIGEIDERVDATGAVVVELNDDQVRSTVRRLVEVEGAEAIAICYLWSFLNTDHELRTRDLIREDFPDVFVSTSCELYPVIREYERMTTTVLNAFVSQVVGNYVTQVDDRLADAGFAGRVYLGQSLGGVLDPAEAKERPLHLFNSGPVGGVVGSRRLADALQMGDVITADMGGTSFDVALVREGTPDVTHRTVMERFETGLSQVDITTIGAGGGSICWVDERGAPRIGPKSAGSNPGPACYGRGGTQPTVTDISAVLGYLDPDTFLGGAMTLDTEAAVKSVEEHLGDLGGSAREIAPKVHRIILSTMLDAVHSVSVRRGRDPRALSMIAYGGASGLFVAEICRGIGISRLVLPDYAAVYSAMGMLSGDAIRTEAQSVAWFPETGELDVINDAFEAMTTRARQNMTSRGFGDDVVEITYQADIRFAGQSFDVTIELPVKQFAESDRRQIVDRFKERYSVLYGTGSVWAEFPAQVMTARVLARGLRPKPPLDQNTIVQGSAGVRGSREVYVPDADDWQTVEVHDAGSLTPGHSVAGPCLVEDVDTTIWIPSDAKVERDSAGGFEVLL
jgi:N-methylhydantoinase A